MTTVREKYALYLLHLIVDMMESEVQELVRYGVSPIGFGHMQPLKKDQQKKVLALFAQIGTLTRNAAVKMIEGDSAVENEEQATEWTAAMLVEIGALTSLIGDANIVEREKITSLICDLEKILHE